jgi:amino acid permease
VVVTLLSLQLGWGLWLLPSDYARLGWVPASFTIAIVALLTAYSATLFPRLIAAVDGAVLFGDVGAAAYGRTGRGLVYAFVYGLDATRCVILHLAASQALQHAAGVGAKALPRLGAVVALGAWALSQIRSLPHMSGFLAAGTTGQMFAIAVVLHTLISEPDRKARHAAFAWGEDPVKAAIAILNVFFAYGGQVRDGMENGRIWKSGRGKAKLSGLREASPLAFWLGF